VEKTVKQRWLPNFEKLLNGKLHFNGRNVTHADLAVFDVINSIITYIASAKDSLVGFPNLTAFYNHILHNSAVSSYIKQRKD
jgi:hypothetical protein